MSKYNSIIAGSIDLAQSEAIKRKNVELSHYHLLYGLLKNPATYSSKALKKYLSEVQKKIEELPTTTSEIDMTQMKSSSKLASWITQASGNAIENHREEVSETDLLKFLVSIFPELNIDPNKLKASEKDEEERPDFLIDLNEIAAAGKLDPVIGRTSEIRAVMEILGRRSKNNPVLVGSAGVGKTAIVEGLAFAIFKGSVPDVLKDKTVYSLDLGSLMAGTKFRGEFEERIQKLLKFIKDQNGEAILFIDEIHQLVGAGKTDGAMDAANLLKPALARGELHCIGATTDDEYQKFILGDGALDRRFRAVPVKEPSKEEAIEIIMGLREKLEIHHGIKISDDAIYSAVFLSDQYVNNKQLPDKAIDLVDEASSALKLAAEALPIELEELESLIKSKKILAQFDKDNNKLTDEIEKMEKEYEQKKLDWERDILSLKQTAELKTKLDKLKFDLEEAQRKQNYEEASRIKYSLIPEIEEQLGEKDVNWVLEKEDIAKVISRQTGIPKDKILQSKQDHLIDLNKEIKKRVFGQDQSVDEICDVLLTSYAGLTDPSRPLGSFLLKGPSGVGKTETAKALALNLFSDEDKMIRLDMSEFSEKHSVAKLIGAPAGYIGHEDGGVLTEAIRRNPYSVILFDEIEKAHKDFSDILLQILDDGRLSDNKGRTISFKNTVIFLTTNSKDVEKDFKPEVLGRLDSILEYNSIETGIVEKLINKQLSLLNSRLVDKKISFELDETIINELTSRGVSHQYGARPLASLFNKLVVRPISKKMVTSAIDEGRYLVKKDPEKIEIELIKL